MKWGKKVEPELQWWIETEDCWHGLTDEYFNNLPLHKDQKLHVQKIIFAVLIDIHLTAPTHICCDNCFQMEVDLEGKDHHSGQHTGYSLSLSFIHGFSLLNVQSVIHGLPEPFLCTKLVSPN
jgi:hypothetical protein